MINAIAVRENGSASADAAQMRVIPMLGDELELCIAWNEVCPSQLMSRSQN